MKSLQILRKITSTSRRPSPPRHHGKKMKPNRKHKGISFTATLNQRKNVQDMRLEVYTTSPPSPLPPHPVPQMSPILTASCMRRASTVLPALGGHNSLIMRNERDRETILDPLFLLDIQGILPLWCPIPDVDSTLIGSGTHAASTRSRPAR